MTAEKSPEPEEVEVCSKEKRKSQEKLKQEEGVTVRLQKLKELKMLRFLLGVTKIRNECVRRTGQSELFGGKGPD